MEQIKWNEQGKIRVRESTEAQAKHLIVKSLVMFYIKIKHKDRSNIVKMYTEWPINSGKICDVYYENAWSKEAIAYEIQDKITTKWSEETQKAYDGWEVHGIKNADYVVIDLNKISDDINKMKKQIKELVI